MKIRTILILIITIFISTTAIASKQDIKIVIDGIQLHTETPSKIINNRTLAPMREVYEALGAEVFWDNSTRTAIGKKWGTVLRLQIGNPNASIDGRQVVLDTPPMIDNDKTLVPIRFIAESLDYKVNWNGKTNTITINTKLSDGELEYTYEHHFDIVNGDIVDYSFIGGVNVVIPNTVWGDAVKGIYNYAFSSKDLRSVIMPDGVTDIGNSAFSHNYLQTVVIPERVTRIGNDAFADNNLTSVTLPQTLKYIKPYAFYDNKLTSLTIPDNVDSIYVGAFAKNNLTSVIIPKEVRYIHPLAFDPGVEIIRE